jgi:hypothetical protein
MTKQEFLTAFKNSLGSEKVSAEFVEEQVKLLSEKLESLPEEDFEKSSGEENISMLVRSSVEEYLARTRMTDAPTSKQIDVENSETIMIETEKIENLSKKPEPKAEDTIIIKADEPKAEDTIVIKNPTPKAEDTMPVKKAAPIPAKKPSPKPQSTAKKPKVGDDIVSMDIRPASKTKTVPSEKKGFWAALFDKAEENTPSLLFTIIMILALPLLIVLAFVSIGTLASLYFALAAVILALVLLIIFIVCGGTLTSLVALLYGATQIMQEPRYVGIHEIGLALIILGCTILASVLLYNLAVRLIPWTLSKASVLFSFLFTKFKLLVEKLRKGCEKL